VAGFPEGHVLAPNRDADAQYLKSKTDAGADFIITQLFFKQSGLFRLCGAFKEIGREQARHSGILPITDYNALVRFCGLAGHPLQLRVHEIFRPLADDPVKTWRQESVFGRQTNQRTPQRPAPPATLLYPQ